MRQAEVEHDHFVRLDLTEMRRLDTIGAGIHGITRRPQITAQRLPQQIVILNQQQAHTAETLPPESPARLRATASPSNRKGRPLLITLKGAVEAFYK
jgi:hypothetical protein